MCVGVPGRIIEILPEHPHLARVDVRGAERRVNIGIVEGDGAQPGDWVDIHLGMAVSILDESEARATLQFLEEMEQAMSEGITS